MTALLGRWRRLYGAGPLHLAIHLIAFGIALFAVHRILVGGHTLDFIAWFLGAAILHDLVLLPVYSLLDRVMGTGVRRARRLPGGIPLINHVRAPALISGVLLLVYFPVIFGPGAQTYYNESGHHLEGYLRHWLLISAGLFLASGLVYTVRRWRVRRARE